MSFCRLCGAGFEFVGEHKPGCEAVTPKPTAAPETCPTCRRPWSECTAASRCTAPAAPEMPADFECDCGRRFTIDRVRALLATQGLSIVDAKDRAVLDAMSQVPDEMLHNSIEYKYAHEASKPVALAELARREKP